MKYLVVGITVLIAFPAASFGQRPVFVPGFGGGEAVEYVAEPPPHLQAVLDPGTKIGFMYWYFCIGSHRVKLWTSDGKFVFYEPQRNAVWDLSDDEFRTLVGTATADSLSTPWSYYLPGGQVTILVILLIILVYSYFHRRKEKHLISLDNDPRYQEALAAYAAQMPEDRNPSIEERQGYLETATASLVAGGIEQAAALKNLATLVGNAEATHAAALRDEAQAHFEAGEYEEAATLFHSAAQILEMWNVENAKFLARRGQECLKKLGRELSG